MIGNTGNRPRTSTHHISHGAGSPHPPATTHSSTLHRDASSHGGPRRHSRTLAHASVPSLLFIFTQGALSADRKGRGTRQSQESGITYVISPLRIGSGWRPVSRSNLSSAVRFPQGRDPRRAGYRRREEWGSGGSASRPATRPSGTAS